MLYAQVIVNISHDNVDRPFSYIVPEELREQLRCGDRVRIPFGKGNAEQEGYIVGFTDHCDFPPERMKSILSKADRMVGVDDRFIRMAGWMHEEYGCTTIAALKTVLPVKKAVKGKKEILVKRSIGVEEAYGKIEELRRKHYTSQARLMEELIIYDELPGSIITSKLMVTRDTIKRLQGKQLITVSEQTQYRNPVRTTGEKDEMPVLSSEQQAILDDYKDVLRQGLSREYLIHGITGSGKTEVYMRLIAETLAAGKQVIMLIPEIALTYQTLMRFFGRFGDHVTVMNSRLSDGEKYDQMRRAKEGLVDIVIGPRSALFTPFERLGLIIVDEEQEPGYKSESIPRYHVRDVASFLKEDTGCSIVYGSATPSLEIYQRAREGEVRLFKMTKRLTGGMLPKVYVEDLRKELEEGNKSIFSRKLHDLMEDRLRRGKQIMLFLNRRGLAGFVSCRSCGEVIKCPHCDVSLSEHSGNVLMCHYCGYTQPKIVKCPYCGKMRVASFRAGTEEVETLVRREFPTARTLRMDADTTTEKDSYDRILEQFREHQADVLIGTQMIVKGHDFKDVTLVGVLAADMSLYAQDFRAAERTFDLLTQAAGRAGRGEEEGEVVIQTYKPDHYAIRHAAAQDYEGFFEEEMLYREMAGYPPAQHLLLVLVQSYEAGRAKDLADRYAAFAKDIIRAHEGAAVIVLGPAEASVFKKQDLYRMVIYVKSTDKDILLKVRDRLEEQEDGLLNRKLDNIQYDMDPLSGI